MDKILHDPKDPKLWELWYIPYYGSCRILSISRTETQTLPVLRFGFSGLRLVRLKACEISVLKEVLELEICRLTA